ncbi:MAG: DUF4124 domain-containing protein [Thiotrichaceae bacterium]|nr:DUF4124 domain-containing protein [Thiotrichaceae bacterium]
MKISQLILLISLGSVGVVSSVHAEIYKWKDINGQTHYTQHPGPAGSQVDKLKVGHLTKSSVLAVTKKPMSRKKDKETRVKKESYKEKLNRYCVQQRKNLKTLDTLKPVVWEENGKTHLLESKERKEKIIEVNANLDMNCS